MGFFVVTMASSSFPLLFGWLELGGREFSFFSLLLCVGGGRGIQVLVVVCVMGCKGMFMYA